MVVTSFCLLSQMFFLHHVRTSFCILNFCFLGDILSIGASTSAPFPPSSSPTFLYISPLSLPEIMKRIVKFVDDLLNIVGPPGEREQTVLVCKSTLVSQPSVYKMFFFFLS